jgi:hypothetical protein
MKTIFLVWLATVLLLCPITATAAEYSAQTGLTYQSWTSDEDEKGSQLFLPIQMDSTRNDFYWYAKTGYASTNGDLDSDSEQSISGALDSQVGLTYSLPRWAGFDWLVGLDLNLPSGQTGQDERKVRIMIDPDLVSIISPGQGLNINPTLSMGRQWGPWMAGLGLGYALQGEYDFSDQTRNYDPGDILNVAGQMNYAFSDTWTLNLIAQYVTIGTDRVDGTDLLQKGDTWLLGATVNRSGATWDLALSVQNLIRSKARVKDPSGSLATESKDSQGNEWLVDLNGRYKLRPRTAVTAGLQYLHLAENGYARSSAFYMGSRQKVSLSMGVQQQLSGTLDLQFGLGGFLMDDNANWLHPNDDRRYQGWSLTTFLSKHF